MLMYSLSVIKSNIHFLLCPMNNIEFPFDILENISVYIPCPTCHLNPCRRRVIITPSLTSSYPQRAQLSSVFSIKVVSAFLGKRKVLFIIQVIYIMVPIQWIILGQFRARIFIYECHSLCHKTSHTYTHAHSPLLHWKIKKVENFCFGLTEFPFFLSFQHFNWVIKFNWRNPKMDSAFTLLEIMDERTCTQVTENSFRILKCVHHLKKPSTGALIQL